jgi:hypothetical protein
VQCGFSLKILFNFNQVFPKTKLIIEFLKLKSHFAQRSSLI